MSNNETTFDDLILRRILFEPADKAKTILEDMFPGSEVSVEVVGNLTTVGVDDVTMNIRAEPA